MPKLTAKNVVIAIVIIYLIKKFVWPSVAPMLKQAVSSNPSFEPSGGGDADVAMVKAAADAHANQPHIVVLKAAWCGACKKLLASDVLDSVAGAGVRVLVFEVGGDNAKANAVKKKFKLEHFPTIFKFVDGGESFVKFDDSWMKSSKLISFAKS